MSTGQGTAGYLTWFGIVRLGLVQTALGAVVVMTNSTLNRVMVVELQMLAMVPGVLVALHYAVQMSRPKMGHGSDLGGRRTPWIVGGMASLAAGGLLAAVATAWMATDAAAGLALAVVAYVMIGGGVSAAGTTLLVLLAKRTAPRRQAAAATIVWVMMIFGFAVTAGIAGSYLDPFSMERLVTVAGTVSALAFAVALLAVRGIEGHGNGPDTADDPTDKAPFWQALREVWAEPEARRFTIFVFVSMFAYNTQELILEPFAGKVFGFTPGESTQLSGMHHGGVLVGMILFAAVASIFHGRWFAAMRLWLVGGCLLSAAAYAAIVAGASGGPGFPLAATVAGLGFGNGVFAAAAIASMMGLVGKGRARREGVRMGVWGLAQAFGFGLGLLFGAAAYDILQAATGDAATAYAGVFAVEGLMFLAAALLGSRLRHLPAPRADMPLTAAGPA